MGNKGIEIVIADGDSTQIAKQIATYASKDEMRVVDMVSTGDEAVESIKLYKPDIVILDICLSGMDGLGVMEHMSELPEYQNTIFVVLTSVSSQRLIRCAFEMGATYYILKPYNPVQLVTRLRQMYMKKKELESGLNDKLTCLTEKSMAHKIENTIESDVTDIIRDIGIPANIKGYQYIREGIIMAVNDVNMLNYILQRRESHKTCHRGGVEQRSDRHHQRFVWIYSECGKRQTDKFRVYRTHSGQAED